MAKDRVKQSNNNNNNNKTKGGETMEKRIDWGKLVDNVKEGKGTGGRVQSGLRQHIKEILAEVPEGAREKLQGQPIGVWAQVLKAVLIERYPEVHGNDRNLYNKIRVNISSWTTHFDYDKDSKTVRYLKW
ncbi:MAG: hypothetical protein DRP85_09060 [Candidatus Makaraimicrobium thalassicum]|nr:MAG: hypothetical protein DRP85_09060 [Candidatus Omnitrophota bacterium]